METLSSPTRIHLKPGETVNVEPGAMLAFSNCEMRTQLAASSIFTRWLGGESMIQNQFKANRKGGWVALEEHMPGQIMKMTLTPFESPLLIRRTALIAESPNVELEPKYLGLSGFFSGRGIVMMRASVNEKQGDVHFHTTEGVVREIRVSSQEGSVYVDNSMILAYSESLRAEVTAAGQGVSSWFFSGEGLVTKFEGDGVIYVGAVNKQYQPPAERREI